MNKKQPGFGVVEALLLIVVLGLIVFTGWYVWHSKQSTDKTFNNVNAVNDANTRKSTPKQNDGWKTYTSEGNSISFMYPGDWFVRSDPKSSRIYLSNSNEVVTKENMPADFQQVWITTGTDEASINNETNVKNGHPTGRVVDSAVISSVIGSGSLTINTYEYDTTGGKTLQAFWSNSSGIRYYATNSTEVGKVNQQSMVDNLKKILATVKVN